MKKFTLKRQLLGGLFMLLISPAVQAGAGRDPVTAAVKPVAWQLSGKVLSSSGEPLPGVTVLLKGSTTGTATGVDGTWQLSVPETSGTLLFSFIGYLTTEKTFNGPGTINVTLADDAKSLQEVVVTGYTTQAKRDIIGAVSVVETKDLLATPAANVQQQLQGRVSGVTTSGTGQPGAGAKVRVRGFGSFGANDPLYVVDGVPTSNVNELNPNDIESMQVLKDASSASIYGSRAANGVIIITTRQGKAGTPKLSVNSFYGVQTPPKGPDLLNTAEYGQYLFQSFKNAGQAWNHPQYGNDPNGPTIPEYILPTGAAAGTVDESLYNIDPAKGPINQIVKANKQGTNHWDELFDPASIQSHQVGVTGGSEASKYAFSFNYFDQKGIAQYTNYRRYTVRANTESTIAKRFRIGENVQVSYNEGNQGPAGGESDIQHIYVMQPIVPTYDIRGNFAGSRGGGLGNARSPVAQFFRNKDNRNSNIRLFGNVFGEVDLFQGLTARTSFGTDYNTYYGVNFGFATYERAENVGSNRLDERNDYNLNWTWTNTLTYKKTFGDHNLTALVGYEAIKNNSRGISGARGNFFTNDPNFRVLSVGGTIIGNNSYSARTTLVSSFGRLDYGLKDKYLFNATIRRDGSSKFGIENQFGSFPAFGAAWRVSGEEFMAGVPFINDLKLRAGWGQMGNQAPVDPNNAYTLYRTSPGSTGYDIGGSSTSLVPGYDVDLVGNPLTKWEASTTTNLGLDLAFWDNRFNLTVDAYNRRTNDLLVPGQAPGVLGVQRLAFINLGDIRNKGIDINLTNQGELATDFNYDVTLTFSTYKNEVLRVGANENDIFESYGTRWGQNIARTQKGQPLGAFYGYQIDGFFDTESELNDLVQTGEHVGGWRFKDLNGDKAITGADRTFIGNPHADFTSGLNLGLRYKAFDLSTFFYASVGNDLFNYNKYFTDFNTFQGNRSKTMLYDSWRPGQDNSNAKLPILRIDDVTSNNVTHDYYVEDGSFLRMRTLQVGYTLPGDLISGAGFANARIYLQGQNVFTITKYTGIDPDISLMNQGGNAAQSDLNLGIDAGYFPNPKQFLVGVSFGF